MKKSLLIICSGLLLSGCQRSNELTIVYSEGKPLPVEAQTITTEIQTSKPEVMTPTTNQALVDTDSSTRPDDNVNQPLVQIALLLDTSGSMSGMITQAKTQLWSIVNQFIKADRNGVVPQVQVSLYQYGSPELGNDNGYIKQLAPLTDDLDKIAGELFKLKTSGGDEYCGWALKASMDQLKWSDNPDDYKAIFIAGNEPFGQGPVDYTTVCRGASEKGIIINTIHCSGGSSEGWQNGALLAGGNFTKINTNRVVAEIATPYDKQIVELNKDLNTTYIGYGKRGGEYKQRQADNDASSFSISSSNNAQRAVSKSSSNYNAASWDIVDAVKRNGKQVKDLKVEELPKEMQVMTPIERETYVKEKSAKREKLQQQILEINTQREAFLVKKQKELATNEDTLGTQVEKTVIGQAMKKGFNFKK